MKPITALAPWFGSNRTLAENVGRALAGCEWVGVPFAGGMCELLPVGIGTSPILAEVEKPPIISDSAS